MKMAPRQILMLADVFAWENFHWCLCKLDTLSPIGENSNFIALLFELCLLKSALAVIADAILFLVTVCKNRKLQKKRERGREKKKSAACRDGQQLHRSVRKLNFVSRRHSCHFPSLGVLPTCWSFDLFHRLPHYVYSACFHMAHWWIGRCFSHIFVFFWKLLCSLKNPLDIVIALIYLGKWHHTCTSQMTFGTCVPRFECLRAAKMC